MWEVISRGVKPYSDVAPSQLKRYLRQGRRLEQPEFCPDILYVVAASWVVGGRGGGGGGDS